MTRGRGPRRALRAALVAGLLAVAAAGGWLVVLPLALRPRVESVLAGAIGAPASVGSLSVGPRADLFLRAVRLGDAASGPTVEELDVDPDLRRVLRGEMVLNRVAARGIRASIEVGAYGGVAVRGLVSNPETIPPGGLDVREVVLRDARVDLPGRDGEMRLDLDRLVVRQLPDAAPGAAIFAGFAEGGLGEQHLRGEGLVETGAGERRVDLSVVASPVRFPGGTTAPTPTERERLSRLAAAIGAWPELEVVLRSGCAPGASAGDPLAPARLGSVRAMLVDRRGLLPSAVANGRSDDAVAPGPNDGPGSADSVAGSAAGSGCVRLEIRNLR